jgi:hypothetical protein
MKWNLYGRVLKQKFVPYNAVYKTPDSALRTLISINGASLYIFLTFSVHFTTGQYGSKSEFLPDFQQKATISSFSYFRPMFGR